MSQKKIVGCFMDTVDYKVLFAISTLFPVVALNFLQNFNSMARLTQIPIQINALTRPELNLHVGNRRRVSLQVL